MNDARNDQIEGYCDGVAGHHQSNRGPAYREAREEGAFDKLMMAMVAEWKRRAALPVQS